MIGMRLALPLVALAVAAMPAEARAPRAARAAAGLSVVSAGGEQALKAGSAIVARPFGAALVDRLAIDGSYPVGREHLYLVRGTAGADCAARYVIVATRAGAAPAVSAPFGTCAAGAAARVVQGKLIVTVAAAPGTTGSVRYIYENGSIRPLDPAAAVADAAPLTCRPFLGMVAGAGGLDGMLEDSVPEAYRSARQLRRADIPPETLREIVTELACLATLPDGGDVVPRTATPIFASKRHGEAAYAALDQVARTPATAPDLRAAVRAFSAQMQYYVARREPL